jgi:TolB protein
MRLLARALAWTAAVGLVAPPLAAQWTNRYPKVKGFGHHVYLEGYELPLLTSGPIDPAPSPDGRQVAVASRGWLWLFDVATGTATRLTRGAGLDSRPAWSPDGRQLAFVRDDGRETTIVTIEVATGQERVVAAEPGIELDPAYAPDGRSLYHSSAVAGDLDLWRIELGSGAKTRITEQNGLELRPMPHPDGKRIVYLFKGGSAENEIRIRDLASGTERTLLSGAIVSMARPALSPDGKVVAVNWPTSDASGWDLRLLGVDQPGPTVLLAPVAGLPLTPSWSADGRDVYYSEANAREMMELKRVPMVGGLATTINVARWDYGTATGRIAIRTQIRGRTAPARITVRDAAGHPLIPEEGQARFDGQNGLVFFYSPGVVELDVPAGPITVAAVQGLTTPVVSRTVDVGATAAAIDLELTPVWDPAANGWLAGEHHFHLNYGGPYRLDPEDLYPMAGGEAMDVLTPLFANLHTRFEDQPLWSWHAETKAPYLRFGQEVRAHFFGHVALIGTGELFWPWIWGPGYEIYSRDDRPNADALRFGRQQGGVTMYVHPVMRPDPFAAANLSTLPPGFVPDAVMGLVDVIELACLWSDERGTAELWYRMLNFGVPIAPSAGTDVMNNLYRTMAVGTTRVYVRVDSSSGYRGYLDGLKAGRSFVTTGPMVDFRVGTAQPGDVIARTRRVSWTVDLASANPVERLELVVNGAVMDSTTGVAAGGTKRWAGTLQLPAGGWVAVRAVGGATTAWPAMDSYAYAHTAPIWIGERGSTVPNVKRAAAVDLLAALDVAEKSFKQAYTGSPTPRLDAHYQRAREILTAATRAPR